MKKQTNFLFFVLFAIMFSVIGCTVPDGEITEYNAKCIGLYKNGACDGHVVLLNRVKYGVSVQRQEVIRWVPGIYEVPVRLENCVVRDKKNWGCWFYSGSISMVGGDRQEKSTSGDFYIEGWRWWLNQLIDKIGGRRQEAGKAAIKLVKDSDVLGGYDGAESILKGWIEEKKGTVKIIGWKAKAIEAQTYLVSYTFDEGNGIVGYFFEVNLIQESVVNALLDSELKKKYGLK